MSDANAKLAEDSMDVDGEQQAASAAAKKLKHLKDKVMPGGVQVLTVGDRADAARPPAAAVRLQ